jgi:hypothetical protein
LAKHPRGLGETAVLIATPAPGRYARRMRYPGENSAGRTPSRRQSPSGRVTPPEARPAASGTRAGGKASRASLFAPGYSSGRASDHAPAEGGRWYGPAGGTAGKGPAQGFAPAPGQPPPLYPPGQFAAWNRASAQGGNGYDPSTSGPISDVWPAAAETGHPAAWYADAGHGDAGYADAGYGDAGYGDAGDADAGYPDAGYADAGYADERYLDQGHPEPGYADPNSAEPGYPAPAVNNPAPDVTSTPTWGAVGDTSATSSWGELNAGLAGLELAGPGLAGPGLAGPGLGHPDSDADRATTDPNQRATTDPNQRAATGPFDRATPAPFNRGTTAPSQRVATRPDTGPRPARAPGRGPGTRGRGSRGRKRPRRRGSRVRVLLACGLALIVVAGAAYFLLTSGHKSPGPAADSQQTTGARSSPRAPSPSPSPSLGPWGHIESRALDPVPLTLAELFPASFTDGSTTYVMTVEKAKVHCGGALAGSQLISAVSSAGCTQAMRASYLSSGNELMGTIGVLNLITAAAAEQVGKAAGPSEFIAQLPAASGPTKNLTKGTGFEAAEVKGHYLVLVWAEFANLHAPSTALQRSELKNFISLLMQKTANVSLATRQVTGSPPT